MRIVLLGATGGTGRALLEQTLKDGHERVALVRDPAKLPSSGERLRVVEGTLSDERALDAAFAGADAVLSGLGLRPGDTREGPAKQLPAILAAMRRHGVRRYVGVSGAGVDAPGDKKPLFPDKLIGALVRWLSPAIIEDKELELATLMASDVEWTLARAPRLTDGPRTAHVRVDLERPRGIKISRADLAAFMLEEAVKCEYVRRAPFITA